ncbi:MAG: transposase [bacterium]
MLAWIPIGILTRSVCCTSRGPYRFHSEKQFRAYARLTPRISQSGRRPPYTRLSRTGGTAYRALLHMAVLSAIRCNPVVRDFHQRKLFKGKARKVALVYAMIKLSQLLFGTWRRHSSPSTGGASP